MLNGYSELIWSVYKIEVAGLSNSSGVRINYSVDVQWNKIFSSLLDKRKIKITKINFGILWNVHSRIRKGHETIYFSFDPIIFLILTDVSWQSCSDFRDS